MPCLEVFLNGVRIQGEGYEKEDVFGSHFVACISYKHSDEAHSFSDVGPPIERTGR